MPDFKYIVPSRKQRMLSLLDHLNGKRTSSQRIQDVIIVFQGSLMSDLWLVFLSNYVLFGIICATLHQYIKIL